MKKNFFAIILAAIVLLLGASAFAVEPFISIREEQVLYTGESINIVSKVTSVKGKYKCEWSVSDEGIIRIVPDGKNVQVRALRPGEATLKLVVTDEAASYERLCRIMVHTAVSEISVSGARELTVGDATILSASVSPSEAPASAYTWKSSNSAVARVDSNGCVVAQSKGTVKITAKALNQIESEPHVIEIKSAPITGTASVELSADGLPLAQRSVMPSISPAMPLYAGTTLQLSLENLDHKYDPSWKSTIFGTNDASIATITNDGLVSAYSPGTVMVYVYDSKTSELIKVWNLVVYDKGKMTLSKRSVSLKAGKSYALQAFVDKLPTTASWKTSDASVASVNENGVVTGIGKGSATITAYIGQEMAASCKVKVK